MNVDELLAAANKTPILLDGSSGSALEAQGTNTALWNAQVLLDAPERIVAAHNTFFDAGARVAVGARSGHTCAGEPLEEVIGVGVNCYAPNEVADAVRVARSVTDKFIVVYPNSGEERDACRRRWGASST
ncbi:hypothetical protein C5C66_07580 [Rathayibacter toxicus]|uniref:Hcy-binding domain-containing protein n=1 Tax=Rathayibacter toxicus TaxID=145458 RepID=A0A0C5BAG1_9MICO|nr:hypothetical protein TI83_07735 [Rathayibacter toxicus]ALS57939.1 hypothetical protein APU90_09340 [Rathayibacter toxicus]KKM44343.1 hypothetical protein VT73_10685 [Rathayibacter toxicus]PPG20377.1 hypothetical protein C5D15_07580 [Rathayibacter toxicus]PPG45478.1 hypothetical protein C5D16_07545 [Rathayibacter toxicus]